MEDRYFDHIVGCLRDAHERADNGWVKVTDDLVYRAMYLLKEQQARIERFQPKKGHWEMKEDPFGLFDGIPVCSECGCTNAMRKKTEFCEHCGADMREGDGDGNHS